MAASILIAVEVLAGIALLFGLLLAFSAKAFEVETDPRLPLVTECLAGANCGGCGYPGCAGCAQAIIEGKAPVDACKPVGKEGAQKIAEIMGVEAPKGERMVAHVQCNGGLNTKKNFEYQGVKDCWAATKVVGGDYVACQYGCLGFGACVKACKFDAIHIGENGTAEVDKEKCTNCGACRETCPRHLIKEVPYANKTFVNCSNHLKGVAVTKIDEKGCLGCGLCERTCKFNAIHVIDNLAVIDYKKCKGCTMCAKICPHGVIEPVPTEEERARFKEALKKAAAKKAEAKKEE